MMTICCKIPTSILPMCTPMTIRGTPFLMEISQQIDAKIDANRIISLFVEIMNMTHILCPAHLTERINCNCFVLDPGLTIDLIVALNYVIFYMNYIIQLMNLLFVFFYRRSNH